MSAANQESPQYNGRYRPGGLAPEELNCSECRFAPTGLSEGNRGALRVLMAIFNSLNHCSESLNGLISSLITTAR